MRALVVLLLALLAAACGGSSLPSSPSSVPTTERLAASLPSGRYVLSLTSPSPGPPADGSVLSVTLCVGRANHSAGVPIEITADADGWRGRAITGSLTFTLQRSGTYVWGPIDGEGLAADGTVVAFGGADPWENKGSVAALWGRLQTTGRADGTVDGRVEFRYAGSSESCNTTGFTIGP